MFDTPALGRRQLIARTAVIAGGAALVGATELRRAHTAHAATAPRVYTRAEWSARPPTSAATIIKAPDHLVVHHMAFPNSTDYSQAHAFQLSRDCQDLHMDTNGRAENVMGAQVANENGHTLGIENEGTYTSVLPPTALWNSLVQTLAWLCGVYGLDPHASILGHRDYNPTTECPGDAFYAKFPMLRDDVASAVGLARTEQATPYVRSNLPRAHSLGDHRPAVRRHDPRTPRP